MTYLKIKIYSISRTDFVHFLFQEFGIVFYVLTLCSGVSIADSTIEDKGKFYVEGMFDERSKLNSGIVDINFEVKSISGNNGIKKNEYTVAFDFRNNLLHYHQIQEDEKFFVVRDENFSYYYANDATVSKFDLTWTKSPQELAPFDVRCLGIYGPVYFMIRESYDELKIKTLGLKIIEIKEDPSGRYQIVFETNTKNDTIPLLKTVKVIDTKKGFSPIESKTFLVVQESGITKETLMNSTSTKWGNYNGVWLTETVKEIQHHAGFEYQVQYNWKNINESIDKKWFSFSSMSIADGAYLVDNRLDGSPIIEGTFKDDILELTGEAALAAAAAEAQRATARRMFWIRVPLIGIGLALIVFALYSKIQEYRTNQSNKPKER